MTTLHIFEWRSARLKLSDREVTFLATSDDLSKEVKKNGVRHFSFVFGVVNYGSQAVIHQPFMDGVIAPVSCSLAEVFFSIRVVTVARARTMP
jgi:hypothetical protein